MQVLYDKYTWKNKFKILTAEQMNIDGLEMFGHDNRKENRRTLRDHIHASMEIVYVVSGKQRYCMNGTEYTLTGNQMFIAPAYTVHGSGNVAHGRCEIYWFRLEMSNETSFLMLDNQTGDWLRQRLLSLSSCIISPVNDLKAIIRSSFELISSREEIKRTQGCALLVQFLCELLESAGNANRLSEQMQLAVDYIHSHIDEWIALDQLASVCSFSLSHFKARFRQELKMSPREYINIYKIEKAKEMLTTKSSITDVAYALSFSSGAYFSAVFKRFVGCSPSEYRSNKNATSEAFHKKNSTQ